MPLALSPQTLHKTSGFFSNLQIKDALELKAHEFGPFIRRFYFRIIRQFLAWWNSICILFDERFCRNMYPLYNMFNSNFSKKGSRKKNVWMLQIVSSLVRYQMLIFFMNWYVLLKNYYGKFQLHALCSQNYFLSPADIFEYHLVDIMYYAYTRWHFDKGKRKA